jgi:hypothetical protein
MSDQLTARLAEVLGEYGVDNLVDTPTLARLASKLAFAAEDEQRLSQATGDTTVTLTFAHMDDCDGATLTGILTEAIANLPRDHRVWDFLGRRPLRSTVNRTMADPYTSNVIVPPTSCPNCGTVPEYRRVHNSPWGEHETCAVCNYRPDAA